MALSTDSLPRPDLVAYREALSLSFPEVVQSLVQILGKKLTAYIASAKDVRAVDRWTGGGRAYGDVEVRLRLAYRIVKMLVDHQDSPAVIQAWLMGLNPELQDRVPVRLLRDGELDVVGAEVVAAARAFVAGG